MSNDPIEIIRDHLVAGVSEHRQRARRRRRVITLVGAAVLTVAVVGTAIAAPWGDDREDVTAERSPSAWPLPTDTPDGVWAIAQPGDWHRAGGDLMPNLGWDSLTVASFPLRSGGGCHNWPTRALEDMADDDVLISIMFVGGTYSPGTFSAEEWPVNGFDDVVLPQSETHDAHGCADRPELEIRWGAVSQREYMMWVLVAFGPHVEQEARAETWATLSSLTAPPGQEPPGRPACVVTIPGPESPDLVEAVGDRTGTAGDRWFGTPDLWTSLPINGIYPPRKSVWWSSAFPGGGIEQSPDIDVTWRRLDGGGPVITTDGAGANASASGWGSFMIAGALDPTGVGCWEVTANYKGHELSYVFWRPPNVATLPVDVDPVRPSGDTATMDFDPLTNCYSAELDGEIHAVIWPEGTTSSDTGLIIRLDGEEPGPAVRSLETTGELRPWEAMPDPEGLLPLISHCLTETGQVWLVAPAG